MLVESGSLAWCLTNITLAQRELLVNALSLHWTLLYSHPVLFASGVGVVSSLCLMSRDVTQAQSLADMELLPKAGGQGHSGKDILYEGRDNSIWIGTYRQQGSFVPVAPLFLNTSFPFISSSLSLPSLCLCPCVSVPP